MYIDTIGMSSWETSSSAISDNDLGREAFLTLLVAQLENQDPLNPLEGTDFTAQLAQYSSLEQLFNVNENLETINMDQQEAIKFKAVDLIGKQVVVDGEILTLEQGKTSMGSFNLDEAARCSILIKDANGRYLREISLDNMPAGIHEFEWDGRDDAGNMQEPGSYSFEVMAFNEEGDILPVQKLITGKVTGVDLEGAAPIIYMGEIPIGLSQIVDISSTEPDAV